ncbi:tRNA (guanine-N(7)-)-methyltransferase [Penicillium daleae]|uniref:tRNA (guanine-N(7)-)-methyltransferase n=1 Tax=Penicillium daleae TaxID=63821 RepID=A0AAD6C9Z7_9EURO|nr:tRNA (guanine-N(7)-)-methyltransferase [Penicillium daleae]KAJ5454324.1 tRNA (guanine-N(7)-)-methyltransferase [Penicillium daleae]
MATQVAGKRQQREEYRRKIQEQAERVDGDVSNVKMPKKRFFRQRARMRTPISPAHMDWASHYPAFVDPDPSKINLGGTRKLIKDVEVVDIGCGFGGLLVGLAPLLPDTLMVGMEIRVSVLDYVRSRVSALRLKQQVLKKTAAEKSTNQTPSETPTVPEDEDDEVGSTTTIVPGNYENITGIRANTMKFLPNFFGHHQLSKIFVCFPDPHFKARKHKARIVSESLNAEYAYVLKPGGLMYTITDVEEYHHWGDEPTEGIRDLWELLSEEELDADPCVQVMKFETEESKKVTRNNGNKYVAVFRRKADPEWPA